MAIMAALLPKLLHGQKKKTIPPATHANLKKENSTIFSSCGGGRGYM